LVPELDDPAKKIDAALGALVFYLGLTRLIEGGVISPESFLFPGSTTPAEGVTVNPMRFTREDLHTHAYNTMILMVGSTTIVVDDALDERFGNQNRESDSEIGHIHAVIHQVRNCFAHKPLNPVWQIYPKYQKTYRVRLPNRNVHDLDFRDLNSKPFELGDIGGLNILVAICMSAYDASKNNNEPI